MCRNNEARKHFDDVLCSLRWRYDGSAVHQNVDKVTNTFEWQSAEVIAEVSTV